MPARTISVNNASAVPSSPRTVNLCSRSANNTIASAGAIRPAMPSFLMPGSAPSYSSHSASFPTDVQAARRPSTLASIVLRRKNEVEIVLKDKHTTAASAGAAASSTPTYTTHDEIRGHVVLSFEKDSSIQDVTITFEGQSSTYVEKLASSSPNTSRTTGKHTFLKLEQPVQSQQLPEDGILRAGRHYSIPFLFNVPDSLLPQICSHKVERECIRKHHIKLPPSLGDAWPSSTSAAAVAVSSLTDGPNHQPVMDDLGPAMARISYFIRARVVHQLTGCNKPVETVDKTERIRVIPHRDEEPPIELSGYSDHCLRKVKTVKKGFLKFGKLGVLTAETTQPRSLHLPHPNKPVTEPVTTMTTIKLRFDPATPDEQPPQLGSLVTKIRAYTFYGAAPYRILPEIHHCDNWSNLHGVYTQSVDLSSRNLGSVAWTRSSDDACSSDGSDISRRPSEFSSLSTSLKPTVTTCSTDSSSSCSTSSTSADHESGATPFYTASILVPVSLPLPPASSSLASPLTYSSPLSKSGKLFVPSFHCCIISRSYTLILSLSYTSPKGAKLGTPSITLRTPIQISQEGGYRPPPLDPEDEVGFGEEEEEEEEGVIEHEDEALVAEIERQFLRDSHSRTTESPAYVQHDRLYQQRQRQPSYQEATSPPRRRSSATTTTTSTRAPPPEYHFAMGGGSFGTLNRHHRSTAPTTTEVSLDHGAVGSTSRVSVRG